ncbi:MAG: hypothetical protein ACYDHZ_00885 [Dehalococcoidia bacterium]
MIGTCVHKEQVEQTLPGVDVGTCTVCGQRRRYDTFGAGGANQIPPTVVKLGRIGGAIVPPHTGDLLELDSHDSKDFAAAGSPRKEPPLRAASRKPPPAAAQTVPPAPSRMSEHSRLIHERHLYLEVHKAEIIADYQKLGFQGMKKKWAMPSSTWSNLVKKWHVAPNEPARRPHHYPKNRKSARPPHPVPAPTGEKTVQEGGATHPAVLAARESAAGLLNQLRAVPASGPILLAIANCLPKWDPGWDPLVQCEYIKSIKEVCLLEMILAKLEEVTHVSGAGAEAAGARAAKS